ncbi:hypothetical protein LSAT2_032532 [Lamellibrachia satsuma]|nr:hypothetical protein LSAT2_032532 [Lamellibrachia satsuma]
MQYLLPPGSLNLYERAWNCFPYCRTVLTQSAWLYPVARPCWVSRGPRSSLECLPLLSNSNYESRIHEK